MRKKKSAAEVAAPSGVHFINGTTGSSIEAQLNAIEQERIRTAVSERLIRAPNDLRHELSATTERNRRRIERLEGSLRLVPDPDRIAALASMHADLEQLLAVYWFFITARASTPTPGDSVHDASNVVGQSLEPFSELLFDC